MGAHRRAARPGRAGVDVRPASRSRYAAQTWWWDPLRAIRDAPDRPTGRRRRPAGRALPRHPRGTATRPVLPPPPANRSSPAPCSPPPVSGGTLRDVVGWLQDGRRHAVTALDTAGAHVEAGDLEATLGGAEVTTKGIYQTARTATKALTSERILRWITPPHTWRTPPPPGRRLLELDVWRLLAPTHTPTVRRAGHRGARSPASPGAPTVHLLSKEGAGTAAPVVAALVDRILEVAELTAQARGGRLDPPVVAVLDEAANICPIHDTAPALQPLRLPRHPGPHHAAELPARRRGVGHPRHGRPLVRRHRQTRRRRRRRPPLPASLSGLIGDHDVEKISTSHGRGRGGSRQYSTTREPVLPASTLRALPKTHAVLLATGRRAGLGELLPWYREPDHTTAHRRDITTSAAAALDELRRAAVTALGPTTPSPPRCAATTPEEEVGDAPPRRHPPQPHDSAGPTRLAPEQPAPPTGLVPIDPRLLAELQARLTALEAWRAHQSDLLDELLNPTNPAAAGPTPANRGRPTPRPRGTAVPAGLGPGRLLPSRGRSTATR